MKPFDPRAWFLFAGLWLASSCSDRAIGAGENASDSSGSGSTGGTESDSESSGETTLDTGGPDPWEDDHCNSHRDCDLVELCHFDFCQSVTSPQSCEPPDVAFAEISVESLSLSFADVDDDGAKELVIATQTELLVYESGADIPRVSPRGLESDSIDTMVGAPLDGMPGDDVLISVGDELRQHGSDGVGNFGPPSTSASPLPDTLGLLAGEFDGQAPADLLVWAQTGAQVLLGSGGEILLDSDPIESATARSLDAPVPGFTLQSGPRLEYYTAGGGDIGFDLAWSDVRAVTSIQSNGDSRDLSASEFLGWSMIEMYHPEFSGKVFFWGLVGRVDAMAGANFDGDDVGDVALIIDGAVKIQFDAPDTVQGCIALYPHSDAAAGLAVGDHDGDGDDELAVRFETGDVAIFDGE